MSTQSKPAGGPEEARALHSQTAEMVRSGEALREEIRRLLRENAELTRRLADAALGTQADRATRRAALNLMEDAVAAQRARNAELAERRRVEEELRQADRRKDEFLATLAHELRNPLAPIRNSLYILRMAGNRESADYLHALIERQINHLVRLVDDLMEVSRITRGMVELRREVVDLADLVCSAVETSKPLIDAARHRLQVDLPERPLLLDADPVRITQVLSNLLNNAAKYTDDGGRISLTAWREGDFARFMVRDTGSGIPAEMLPRVFDLFTQVEHSYSRTRGGLGIGLTLVRSLVELHGGTVEVRSEGPGRGSEFIVRLPLASGQPRTRTPPDGEERLPALPPHRILVVDDNRDAAETLATLLHLLGADVRTFNNGPDALEVIPSFRPSVMLLDIGMPAMDGNEVARRTRELPGGQDVTLIALTGWGQEEDRRRSKEAGFDHHLIKPVDFGDLKALLATLPAPESGPRAPGITAAGAGIKQN